MTDAAPGHIGNMEETIESVEVDERTEIGDVLDGAFADVAGHHLGEELAALLVAFLLDQFAAGENDVLALLIDFNDFKFVGVADVNVEVFRRGDVDLGGREESFDTDVDEETTFDDGFDFALDGAAFVTDGKDVVPVFLELGLFLGEDDHAIFVLELLDEDVDFVTDFNGGHVIDFVGGDSAFALVADVDQDFLGSDFDNDTLYDLACCKATIALPHGFFHCQHTYI